MSRVWHFLIGRWPTIILWATAGFVLGVVLTNCAPEPHIGPSLTVEEFACVWETEQTEGCVE